jgi:hypothetical protein
MVGEARERAYHGAMTKVSDQTIGGTPRATRRPAHVKPPAGWQNSPVPAPEEMKEDPAEEQPGGRNPVRYGDWELKGIAIDF